MSVGHAHGEVGIGCLGPVIHFAEAAHIHFVEFTAQGGVAGQGGVESVGVVVALTDKGVEGVVQECLTIAGSNGLLKLHAVEEHGAADDGLEECVLCGLVGHECGTEFEARFLPEDGQEQ